MTRQVIAATAREFTIAARHRASPRKRSYQSSKQALSSTRMVCPHRSGAKISCRSACGWCQAPGWFAVGPVLRWATRCIRRRDALAWSNAQAGADKITDPYATPNRMKQNSETYPTNQGVFVGSYATVARLLDEMAEVPGLSGEMLTFDDFLIGMEQFGTRIQPLMRSRSRILAAA